MENYYKDGLRYDLDYASRVSDIKFYVQRCKSLGHEVLELGCGTGRITIPIAESGIKIVGIDSSSEMLERAQSKISERDKGIEFVRADLTRFDLGRKFNTVIMPFNVLQHLYDLKSINNFFYHLKENIDDNGTFIFDVLNPDLYELSRNPDEYAFYDSYDLDGEIVVIEDKIKYNPVTQIADYVLSYSKGKKDLFDLNLKHRMFFTQELEELLNYNDFHILEKLGDFNGGPLDAKSASQVFVCVYRS